MPPSSTGSRTTGSASTGSRSTGSRSSGSTGSSSTSCAPEVDLFDPATQENWFPAYETLRNEAPVFRIPGTNIHVVTRYDDVMTVLRKQDVFPTGTSATRCLRAEHLYRERGWDRITPLSVNPPHHRRYRDMVDHHFNANGSERWREVIDATIYELIDEIVADGATTTEFVESFALPLPVRMITRILGFPDSDIPRLKEWSTAWVLPFSGPLTEDQEVWVAENVIEFWDYIAEHLAMRRDDPGDDVLTALTQATFHDPDTGEQRPLTDHEIVTITDHLYIGGNETTTFALTSGMWIMLREEGLYEQLLADRSLVTPFVEEVLRLESPTQGLYRRVAVDTELAGVTLPAGATVHIRYAAANRDERRFPDPERVVLDRPNSRRHLAFSLGEHHCPGEGLSRLEQRRAFDILLDRLPDLRLADRNDFTHQPGFVLRALNELHLDWGTP